MLSLGRGDAGLLTYRRRLWSVPVDLPPVTEYTITFQEQNSLEGVSIEVRENDENGDIVGSLSTDASGEDTLDLEDGTYWYEWSKEGYQTGSDTFTVDGAAKTVEFTAVVEAATIIELPLMQVII